MPDSIQSLLRGVFLRRRRYYSFAAALVIAVAALVALSFVSRGIIVREKSSDYWGNEVLLTLEAEEGAYTNRSAEELLGVLENADGYDALTLFYQAKSDALVSVNGSAFADGLVCGIDEAYLSVNGYELQNGRLFTADDYSLTHRAALLDSKAAAVLFGDASPLGALLEIAGEPFTVVGVIQKAEDASDKVQTLDDYYSYLYECGSVFLPDSAWPLVGGYDTAPNIRLLLSGDETTAAVAQGYADRLNALVGSSIYTIPEELTEFTSLREQNAQARTLLLAIGLAALLLAIICLLQSSLLMQGQTARESKLRRALGAGKKDLLLHELALPAIAAFFAGCVGVLAAFFVAALVRRFCGTPAAPNVPVILAALVCSALLGALGTLPSVCKFCLAKKK